MAADSSRVAGMKTSSQAPTRLLFSSGTTTRVTAVRRLPPRMRTASSISGLIERMAAEALAKAIGRKRVVKARMRIQAVP